MLIMPKLKTTHVVPNPEGGWDVKAGGSKKATKNYGLKSKAIDRARKISQNKSGELFIHGKNGRIQNRDSHGNDPKKTKG